MLYYNIRLILLVFLSKGFSISAKSLCAIVPEELIGLAVPNGTARFSGDFMRRAALFSAIFLISQTTAGPSHAASGNIEFGGLIGGLCIIVVGGAGVLDVAPDGLTISTSAGSPATAVITTTSTGFELGVGSPTSFDAAPTDGGTGVTFETSYSTTGVTSILDVLSGVTTILDLGITNVSVDLAATRADPFPPGTYTASTVLTCD